MKQSAVKHAGVSWLKNEDNRNRVEQLISEFSEIPEIIDLAIGNAIEPDWAASRIDSSFNLAFVATLKDKDACRAHFEHPIHQRSMVELKELVERNFAMYMSF